MDRRSILQTAVGLTVTTGLTGCTSLITDSGNDVQDSDGDGVIDSQDYAPRDPDVQEESDIQQDGSSESNPEPSEDTPTESGDEQLKQDILDTYNTGTTHQNKGMNNLNAAVSSFNQESYSTSISRANTAESNFETARSKWNEAHSLSLQIDYSQAQQICDDAVTYASRMIAATRESRRAAEDAKEDRMSESNEHIEKHRQKSQSAEELGVKDPQTLKDILDI